MKNTHGGNKQPNSGSGRHGAGKGHSTRGSCSGVNKESSQRSDVTAKPSSPDRYPNGLA